MNKIYQISENVLAAFAVTEQIELLVGGQGNNYRAGDVVLKPIDNIEEYEWIAETMNNIKQDGFRVPHFIKSINGNWVEEGWAAYNFVEGTHKENHWEEKINACELFHYALKNLPCPDFISRKNDPWAIADRVVWGEQSIKHNPRLQKELNKLKALLKPINLPNQLVHGDFTGNVLFQENLPPAIIDFSPYFRPKDFAKAIIVVDALVWEGADESILQLVKDLPEIKQLIIRAEMRRLIEIEECLKYFGKGTLDDIDAHKSIIDLICREVD